VAAKKYISINEAATHNEERDLLKDVGTFAYVDRGEIEAPFIVDELAMGSYRFSASNWNNVTNAPLDLAPSGHFLVWKSNDTTKLIQFIADEETTANCITTRTAELVVILGTPESWNYYVSKDETYKFGEIVIASKYDKGKVTKLGNKTYHVDYIKQFAYLNRGSRTGIINFNTTISVGSTYIVFSSGSLFSPPTTQNRGVLRNEIAGCFITQFWSPDGSNSLYFREKNEAGKWSSWYTATEGNVLSEGKVKVPTFYRRGIGSGYQFVDVYSASEVDNLAKYTAGNAISIIGNVISWTGTAVPFSAEAPLDYDPETGVLSISSFPSHNHDDRYPQLSGSYPNPSWLASLSWSKITGGPSFLTSFTETDPTVGSHIKAITTTNISNWNTAFGWGNHASLYPLLAGSYANPTWITSLAWAKITGAPAIISQAYQVVQANGSNTSQRSILNFSSEFIAADNSVNSRTDVSINSLAWSKITGAPSFLTSFTETDPTVPAHVKAITTTNISNWNTAFGWGNHANLYPLLAGSYANPSWIDSLAWSKITGAPSFLTSFTETDPTVPAHIKAITTTNISNWNTAFGWGNHASLYPLLAGSYANPTWITSLAWAKITGAPAIISQAYQVVQANGSNTSQRSILNFSSEFLAADNSVNSRTDVSINSLAWSKITGAPSFLTSFTETDPTVPAHVKAITTTNISNWNTAFGWGNHANLYPLLAGSYANPSWIDSLAWSKITGAPSFLTSFTETDPTVPAHVKAITTTNISNWNTAFGWGNHANLYPLLSSSYANPSWIDSLAWSKITGAPSFLTSFTETDPTVGSHIKAITTTNISNWNTAFGWGNHANLYPLLAGSYANPTWIDSLAWSKITGAPSFLTSFTETDPTVPNHVKVITVGDLNSWNAKATASGTTNKIAKFTGTASLGNSNITDNGTIVTIGTTSAIGQLSVEGAVWASANSSAVAYYMAGGAAIRAFGTMYLDSYDGEMIFRVGGGFTTALNLKSSGQARLNTYISSSSWSGTAAGLLGFDSSGNVLTYEAVRTNAQNDARYLQSIGGHSHVIGDITSLQGAH
jgi:hypothetical protein